MPKVEGMGMLRPGAKPVGKPMTDEQARTMALHRIGAALERIAAATERKAAALEAGLPDEAARTKASQDLTKVFEAMVSGGTESEGPAR